jgi:hypothetical protein
MKFFDWIVDGIASAFNALFAWLRLIYESMKAALFDLPLVIFDKFVDALIGAFNLFNGMLDCCMSGAASLQGAVDAIPSATGTVYFLDRAGLVPCLACLGAAATFRMIRKLVTLGHW